MARHRGKPITYLPGSVDTSTLPTVYRRTKGRNLWHWIVQCSGWPVQLGGYYQRKDITAANAAIYQRALSDLSAEDLEAACSKALASSRFMPTVADIRAHASSRVEAAMGIDSEWIELLDKVQLYDEYYDKPGFNAWGSGGPPKLREAGRYAVDCCGGWRVFRETSAEFLPKLKREFEQAYSRFSEVGQRAELPQPAKKPELVPMPDGIRKQLNGMVKK